MQIPVICASLGFSEPQFSLLGEISRNDHLANQIVEETHQEGAQGKHLVQPAMKKTPLHSNINQTGDLIFKSWGFEPCSVLP